MKTHHPMVTAPLSMAMAACLVLVSALPAQADTGVDRAVANQRRLFVCLQGQDSDAVSNGRISSETQVRYRITDTQGHIEALATTFLNLDGGDYRADQYFSGYLDADGDDTALVFTDSRLTRADPLPNGASWTRSTGRLEMQGGGDSVRMTGTLTDTEGNALDLSCDVHP